MIFAHIVSGGYMHGFIDMHCHILPNVDDGSRDIEQSVRMLRIAYDDGIRKIIVTPHYHIGRYIVDYDRCEEALALLKKRAEAEGIGIELYSGAEVWYFSDAVGLLEENKIHTLAGSRYVLMEFEPGVDYSRIKQCVNECVMNGYIPVIAHVERYLCMLERDEGCEELKRMGARLQINASGIVSREYKSMRKFIKSILKKHLVAFVATDAHSDGHRRPVLGQAYEYVCKKYGGDYADRIFYENQMKILNDSH